MKAISITTGLVACLLLTNCNKEKKMMKTLEGNWNIEKSEKLNFQAGGQEEVYETVTNGGKLVISEASGGSEEHSMNYDFTFIDSNSDTMHSVSQLVTDEYKTRLVMLNALVDSTGTKNLVWTIEKERRNKQVWITYGVDSTLFYPANNLNPGAATSWVAWRITLKRE